MSSLRAGKNIFPNNISNIIETGFWLLVNDHEYFVPFDQYPEFKHAPIDKIFAVKQISPTQFHWEELDCDVELSALEHPEHFPLEFKRKASK
jgi:hypothetical protein